MRWVVVILLAILLCGCAPGDANNDGCVNILDFSILAAAYGATWGDAHYNWRADFNWDGVVNQADFQILSDHYGECR